MIHTFPPVSAHRGATFVVTADDRDSTISIKVVGGCTVWLSIKEAKDLRKTLKAAQAKAVGTEDDV